MKSCLISTRGLDTEVGKSQLFTWRLLPSENEFECSILKSADVIVVAYRLGAHRLSLFVQSLRDRLGLGTGIIVLGDWLTSPDKVCLFESGADLVESSNVALEVLRAHMRSIHRSRCHFKRRVHGFRTLVIDREAYQASVNSSIIRLTKKEFEILSVLVELADVPVSREVFEKLVFSEALEGCRTLDVHICALRKKLNRFNLSIVSHRRRGYQIVDMTINERSA